ncbi:Starch-binding associating with outer membrane [Parapedobacter composti]|uniref:Starch-binding associating with outer membrane n=1 Tax=Parapedobacter composti TaxID=623281 RepID=A0A1I1L8W2_9SPHI|nr:RagB/SusD family nutrient uptake outer membrane protein [Parapedobacter composti]SFC68952.1 Starch-binding associating with outer membrane [Parapedobacter composti]
MNYIYQTAKRACFLGIALGTLNACGDFLDRPTVDSYTIDSFYQTDEQCFQSVNPIYNSPWYDFQRGFFKVGEVLSGNYYMGNSPYLTFTINSTDQDLVNMSASLWSVNAYCNGVLENVDAKSGPNVSEQVKRTVKGEALVWKAMAYFYLVRTFGAVPIVHNNSAEIAGGNYNEVFKAPIEDVYHYIVLTLEKAIEWLPETNRPGRIDRYTAYGLLAKVYLTKSGYGQSGSRNQQDLDKAAEYALKVIDESGRSLMPVYSDIFRLKNNFSDESLLAWHWVSSEVWTSQNSLQSDLGLTGFSEFGDTWGDWGGPSADLQEDFGENALSLTRNNSDVRRKATMMMYGDVYDYFWADRGGFDYADFCRNVTGEFRSPTGANSVKHLVGNNNDHVAGIGAPMRNMSTSLSTHLLRLADVYLIYAEAVIGNSGSTTNAKALEVYNAVRRRAGFSGNTTSITWRDVWKERRLELACEGDRWYDYVRWHYYEPAAAIAELRGQKRSFYVGLDDFYKTESFDPSVTRYDDNPVIPNVTNAHFQLPFPDTDLTMNPNLLKEPVKFDFSGIQY